MNKDWMKFVGARVPKHIKDQLDQIAKSERRPLSNLIRCVIEDWLKSHGTPETEGKPGHR